LEPEAAIYRKLSGTAGIFARLKNLFLRRFLFFNAFYQFAADAAIQEV